MGFIVFPLHSKILPLTVLSLREMNRLDRLTAILTQLQSKRLIRAQEIADRFGITKDEALSFLVAEKIFEKISDIESSNHFQSAMFKIKSVLRNSEKDVLENMSSQVEVLRVTNSLHSKGKEHTLQSILNSLSESKVILIQYTTFEKEETSSREAEPVGIYYAFEQWYLIAWCRLRKDYRTFRLDRINSIKILEEKSTTAHPSLKNYLAKVEEKEKLIKVVLEVYQSGVKYIKQQRYNHGFVMEQQKGDLVQMTFMTSSLEGFVRWIVMMGDYINIIYPLELKDRMRELLRICSKRSRHQKLHTLTKRLFEPVYIPVSAGKPRSGCGDRQ
jgi:predicted DNA-binding transcriptional regulator YafY